MEMNKEEIEYIELKLRVPKAIVDFLRAHETDLEGSVEEYLEYSIVAGVNADIDSDIFPFEDYDEIESVKRHWGLDKVFDEVLVKPSKTVEALERNIKEMEKFVKIESVRDLVTSEIQKLRIELQSLRDKSNA